MSGHREAVDGRSRRAGLSQHIRTVFGDEDDIRAAEKGKIGVWVLYAMIPHCFISRGKTCPRQDGKFGRASRGGNQEGVALREQALRRRHMRFMRNEVQLMGLGRAANEERRPWRRKFGKLRRKITRRFA